MKNIRIYKAVFMYLSLSRRMRLPGKATRRYEDRRDDLGFAD